jgi:hypothetical protein
VPPITSTSSAVPGVTHRWTRIRGWTAISRLLEGPGPPASGRWYPESRLRAPE